MNISQSPVHYVCETWESFIKAKDKNKTIHSCLRGDEISLLQTLLCFVFFSPANCNTIYMCSDKFMDLNCQRLKVMVGHYQDPGVQPSNLHS